MSADSSITLGKITAVHGIKGWLTIVSYTDNPSDIFTYELYIEFNKKRVKINITEYKILTKKIIIKIEGIDNINEGQDFLNKDLLTNKNNLVKNDDSEFFWHELISCNVYNDKKKYLGEVTSLKRIGDSDILVIKNDSEKKDILIPFVKTYIINVCLNKKVITVIWDENF